MGLPPGASSSEKAFNSDAARRAAQEQERISDRVQRYLEDYVETPIQVNGEIVFVLARRGRGQGDAAANNASGSLQTVVRLKDGFWNVGVTSGMVQAVTAVFPVLKPSNEALNGAPTRWFPEALAPGLEASSRNVWLRLLYDDANFYFGDLTGAEIHLRPQTSPPSPMFTQGVGSWHLIGSAGVDLGGNGGLFPVSHIHGSLQVKRMGGPTSGYSIYAA